MGCSQSNVLDRKPQNNPKSPEQEAKAKKPDENRKEDRNDIKAPVKKEEENKKGDEKIKKEKQENQVKSPEEKKKDDGNIIKPSQENKEENKKENGNIKEESKKVNKVLEEVKKKNEINLVIDISKGERYFICEYFENQNDEDEQYTEDNVEIYIDNIKQEFTREINEEEFPEKKEYHIKLIFKVLFTNCQSMFADCSSITSIDLSDFDMRKVKNMLAMFHSCENLISVEFPNSNTANLTNMNFMFYGCVNLTNVNITSLNTKNVEQMNFLFNKCKKLKNLDFSNLDIGKVKEKEKIFYGFNNETSFKLPKGIIEESVKIIYNYSYPGKIFGEEFVENNKKNIKIIYLNKEYELCSSILDIDKNFGDGGLVDIKLKVIGTLTNLSHMFDGTNLYYLGDLSKLNTSKVIDMSYLFYKSTYDYDIDNFVLDWDTSNVKNMSYLFSEKFDGSNLPDTSKWNTSKVTNMKGMFAKIPNITILPDISKWNVGNVEDMSELFYELKLDSFPDLSKWNTSKVTNMEELFSHVINRKNPPNISNWNTSNVTSMANMFHCYNLCHEDDEELDELKDFPDISKWNVAKVIDMNNMFSWGKCKNFSDISKWNVSNVINMCCMFQSFKCSKFADISKWNVAKVQNMDYMFAESIGPYSYISNWDVSHVTTSKCFYMNFSLKDAKNADEFEKKIKEMSKRWKEN